VVHRHLKLVLIKENGEETLKKIRQRTFKYYSA
jgi:hypothetical protein